MPKQRQIPRLFSQKLADQTIVWHWKPSATLRKAGFVNVELGADRRSAINRAQDLNDSVDVWRAGRSVAAKVMSDQMDEYRVDDAATSDTIPKPSPPHLVRFSELVMRYRESDAFNQLRDSTRAEYGTSLRQLEKWALGGKLLVKDIDKGLVRDLRTGLLRGSVWRAASTLRVLRILLNWAVDESIIATNAATKIDIPQPPPRKTRMGTPVRDAIIAAARALDPEDVEGVALAIDLAFWMIQRQSDVLQLNRFAWREVYDPDVDPRHIAILADPRGRVMAFRLCQQKTQTWVDAPIPQMLHAAIEERMKRQHNGGWLFAHPDQPDVAMPQWLFQRRFRAARDAAAAVAIMDGDMLLAEQIDASQFRDLRRTGMIAYKNAGAKVPQITALSGHYVTGKKTILDVYMPGDTAGAIACVAIGLQAWQRRQQQEMAV